MPSGIGTTIELILPAVGLRLAYGPRNFLDTATLLSCRRYWATESQIQVLISQQGNLASTKFLAEPSFVWSLSLLLNETEIREFELLHHEHQSLLRAQHQRAYVDLADMREAFVETPTKTRTLAPGATLDSAPTTGAVKYPAVYRVLLSWDGRAEPWGNGRVLIVASAQEVVPTGAASTKAVLNMALRAYQVLVGVQDVTAYVNKFTVGMPTVDPLSGVLPWSGEMELHGQAGSLIALDALNLDERTNSLWVAGQDVTLLLRNAQGSYKQLWTGKIQTYWYDEESGLGRCELACLLGFNNYRTPARYVDGILVDGASITVGRLRSQIAESALLLAGVPAAAINTPLTGPLAEVIGFPIVNFQGSLIELAGQLVGPLNYYLWVDKFGVIQFLSDSDNAPVPSLVRSRAEVDVYKRQPLTQTPPKLVRSSGQTLTYNADYTNNSTLDTITTRAAVGIVPSVVESVWNTDWYGLPLVSNTVAYQNTQIIGQRVVRATTKDPNSNTYTLTVTTQVPRALLGMHYGSHIASAGVAGYSEWENVRLAGHRHPNVQSTTGISAPLVGLLVPGDPFGGMELDTVQQEELVTRQVDVFAYGYDELDRLINYSFTKHLTAIEADIRPAFKDPIHPEFTLGLQSTLLPYLQEIKTYGYDVTGIVAGYTYAKWQTRRELLIVRDFSEYDLSEITLNAYDQKFDYQRSLLRTLYEVSTFAASAIQLGKYSQALTRTLPRVVIPLIYPGAILQASGGTAGLPPYAPSGGSLSFRVNPSARSVGNRWILGFGSEAGNTTSYQEVQVLQGTTVTPAVDPLPTQYRSESLAEISVNLRGTCGLALNAGDIFSRREQDFSSAYLLSDAQHEAHATACARLIAQRHFGYQVIMPIPDAFLEEFEPFASVWIHNAAYKMESCVFALEGSEARFGFAGRYLGQLSSPVPFRAPYPVSVPTGSLSIWAFQPQILYEGVQLDPATQVGAYGGQAPYVFAVSGLPLGLGLAGVFIGGTPTQVGVFTAALSVTDAVGATAATTFTVAVQARPSMIPPYTLDPGALGTTTSLAPQIFSVVPAQGGVGATFLITGLNLGGSNVTIGGVACAAATVGSQVSATVPPGATTGPLVITTSGGLAASGIFTVLPIPGISSLNTYVAKVGDRVRIYGSGLNSANKVLFSGVFSPQFAVISAGEIWAQVPAIVAPGPIQVFGLGGASASPQDFRLSDYDLLAARSLGDFYSLVAYVDVLELSVLGDLNG
ncbi:putative Ig domain-containing protein [Candidatus Cyanaurora vandensis]|uniref:putative Ig domain-containing protein n=1 Tax=Candidatus Cyanaurora vandensis TaxID=2714958 RepID=UPI00257A9D5C|nr:putative Ig domain-containing protein [Candidatus Cyanaurora vandensis]